MADQGRLAIRVRHADGSEDRWGSDEPDSADVPSDLSFSTGLPGGFKSLICPLLRRPDPVRPDLGLLDDVLVYGPGLGSETAWEGRQAEFPKRDGSDVGVEADAVGWSAHLFDDPSFMEIYVDRRFDSWGDPSTDRMLVLDAAGAPYDTDYHVKQTPHSLAFGGRITAGAADTIAGNSEVEAWYRCPTGVKAGAFQYVGTEASVAQEDAPTLYTSPDNGASIDGSTYALTLDNTLRIRNPSPARRYLMLRMKRTTAGAKANAPKRTFKAIAVFGTHGLPQQANDDPFQPDGLLASDVIADILARAAPLISRGGIEPSAFVIPHLVFEEPTTANDAITLVNGFHLNDWGVGDGREFFWRDPLNYRRRWVVRRDETGSYTDPGEQAETAVNGVIVGFVDPQGESRTAGPPGSGCDFEDPALEDTSPANIVNAHGIPRKWGRLDVKYPTTYFGAIQLGARWLVEQLATPLRGDVTITGWVRDSDTLIPYPAWVVRAGDSIRVEGGGNVETRIVGTDYDHASRTNVCSLDNTPFRLDAMIEQLGVVLIGRAPS